jgi:hypothetical protein
MWNFQRHNIADVKCGVIDVELQRGIFNVEFSTWNFQRGIFHVATLQRCNVAVHKNINSIATL